MIHGVFNDEQAAPGKASVRYVRIPSIHGAVLGVSDRPADLAMDGQTPGFGYADRDRILRCGNRSETRPAKLLLYFYRLSEHPVFPGGNAHQG